MFSGIIDRLSTVLTADHKDASLRLKIGTGYADLSLGESVAVNGVCLTVVAFNAEGEADFYVSPETLARTSLGNLVAGTAVNLERAVSLSTRLSGHMVQGHVDGLARLAAMTSLGEAHLLQFELPEILARLCVEKGSICIDGISLTINTVTGNHVGVTIIPHTWMHTNLHTLKHNSNVNIEVDVIAKYVEKLCQPYIKP